MGTAIGELLPLAVAIAISVTMIITTVLMLLSPQAKSRTVGLLVGCVVGVAGAVALFTLLADLLPTQDSGGSSLAASVIKMVVGVLLVVLALRQWRGRPAGGDRGELPKWMSGVDSMTPGKALVLGLLLSAVVPKNLLIALSAGLIVGEAGFSGGQAAGVFVLFTAIATSTGGGTGCRSPRGIGANARAIREPTGVDGGEQCDDHGRGSARDRSCHDRQ